MIYREASICKLYGFKSSPSSLDIFNKVKLTYRETNDINNINFVLYNISKEEGEDLKPYNLQIISSLFIIISGIIIIRK